MKKSSLLYFGSFLFSCVLCFGMYKTIGSENSVEKEKQKGVHVFGKLDSMSLQALVQTNFDWITLVPYGDQEDIDSPEVRYYRGDSIAMQRRDSAWLHKIKLAHQAGFKVFVKPHVWLFSPAAGKWRSDIFPEHEANWELWSNSYREFIFRWANIAEQANAELFCIGAEFSRLTTEKPLFWETLIKDIRAIYSGEITYAANWHDEFEQITFWDQLDYIGVQAYFPLVKNEYPSIKQISKGWKKHLPLLKSIHRKYQKQILFTEMGYKSTADSAIEPWAWIDYSAASDKAISMETQANCYEAFFDTVWKEKCFAGVHIWQWRSYSRKEKRKSRGKENLDFTPQEKPAENIIARGFQKR